MTLWKMTNGLFLVISLLLSLAIIFYLIKRYLKLRVNVVLYLSAVILIGMLSDSVALYGVFSGIQTENLEILGGFFGILSGYFLIYFLETYKSEKKPTGVFSIMSFFTGGIMVALFFELLLINPEEELLIYLNYALSTFRGLYYLLFFIYLSYLAYKSIKTIYPHAIDENHKKRLKIIQMSIIVSYSGTALIYTAYNVSLAFTIQMSQDMTNILVSLCAVVFSWGMLYGYAKTPRAYELHPIKIYKLMIISKDGLPIATHDFIPELNKAQKTDNVLIAGAITALRSFMEEITGDKDELRSLVFQTKTMEVEIKDDYIFIVFAENMSTYLKNSLKKFAERYSKENEEQIKKAIEFGEIIELSSEILQDLFGK